MECVPPTKPLKPSSNITDLVSKFAKLCRLRSIGVLSGVTPHSQIASAGANKGQLIGESSSTSDDATGEKVHAKIEKVGGEDKDLLKLFDSVSALKLAYIKLQEAHVPYNPEKILAADETVMSQLQVLCNIRSLVKEKESEKMKLESSRLEALRAEVEAKERFLELLKSQSGTKDAEIARLREEFHDLDTGNLLLVETIKTKSLEKKSLKVVDTATFEEIFRLACKSVHDFAKPLIGMMKASGWDLDLAANAIVNGAAYSKRLHKKYAFEAFISWRMFHGMSLESYNVDDVMRYEDDPTAFLIQNPNSEFAKFCAKKYLFVVQPAMETAFFGNLDHRMLVINGKHPRTPLYQIFAKMARWIWVLQGVSTSIDPQAKLFTVSRGSEFSDIYMESVEENTEGSSVSPKDSKSNCKIEFMVMPGFKIGDRVVKSRVYLSKPQ
ncbi:Protein GRAVITROPIC IN THE LIGHT 1 [Linum perenne]